MSIKYNNHTFANNDNVVVKTSDGTIQPVTLIRVQKASQLGTFHTVWQKQSSGPVVVTLPYVGSPQLATDGVEVHYPVGTQLRLEGASGGHGGSQVLYYGESLQNAGIIPPPSIEILRVGSTEHRSQAYSTQGWQSLTPSLPQSTIPIVVTLQVSFPIRLCRGW